MTKRSRYTVSRRSFVRIAAATISAPLWVPAAVLGKDGKVAPSDRIAMGFIGLGNRGFGGMRGNFGIQPDVEIVAVCDPCDERYIHGGAVRGGLEAARETAKLPRERAYKDFRALLARKDIDAVQIAVGERWHTLIAAAAARAGKHVYCEKPLALSIEDGKKLRQVCQRHGTVFQFGTQQRSWKEFRFACELVRNERIGKLKTVKVGVYSSVSGGRVEADPLPKGLDYELWTGPSPMHPYRRDVVGGVPPHKDAPCYWTLVSAYAFGHYHNWGIHHIDFAQWGMDADDTGPVEVEGKGIFPKQGLCDAATAWDIEMKYANGVRLIYTDNANKYEVDWQATQTLDAEWDWQKAGKHSKNKQGVLFEGTEGWVFVKRREIDAHPKSLLTTTIGPDEIHLPVSPLHERNFLDCVKSGARTLSPVEVAVRSDTLCHLGIIAMKLGRKLKWDPQAERFVDDDAANRLLSCEKRGEWQM